MAALAACEELFYRWVLSVLVSVTLILWPAWPPHMLRAATAPAVANVKRLDLPPSEYTAVANVKRLAAELSSPAPHARLAHVETVDGRPVVVTYPSHLSGMGDRRRLGGCAAGTRAPDGTGPGARRRAGQ